MVQRVSTVAFEGIEARAVDVQVQVAPGLPAFAKVLTNNPTLLFGVATEVFSHQYPIETISIFVSKDID